MLGVCSTDTCKIIKSVVTVASLMEIMTFKNVVRKGKLAPAGIRPETISTLSQGFSSPS